MKIRLKFSITVLIFLAATALASAQTHWMARVHSFPYDEDSEGVSWSVIDEIFSPFKPQREE